MESIIRNVGDIEADERRYLESAVGHRLDDGQQVIIHVVNIGVEPDEKTRKRAHSELCEIARQGRANVEAQGITEQEANAAIDETIEHVRKHPE